MEREVRWERMFPDELDAALAEWPVAYLPYGLCEPHGPHNALGMDGLRAHGVSCEAARRYGGIVAPLHLWHIHDCGDYATWGHAVVGQQRRWLTPLPPWMFFKNLCYHVRAVDTLGFKAAVLYTGHAGPHSRDMPAFIDCIQRHVAVRVEMLDDSGLASDDYCLSAHAGKNETEVLWALEPDCTDMSRIPDPTDPGPHFAMGPDARDAERRHGESMVVAAAAALADKTRQMVADHDVLRPECQVLTYARIEEIWAEELRPLVAGFACMRDTVSGGKPAPPKDSQWYPNWRVAGIPF